MKKSLILAATALVLSSAVALASDNAKAPAKAQHVARNEKARAVYDYVPASTQTSMPQIYGVAY
jgi:hypothetical protein